MNMKKTIRNTALAGLATLVLGTTGCTSEIEVKKYPVEQLFSNHDGYTISYIGENQEVEKKRFAKYTHYISEEEENQISKNVLNQFKLTPKNGGIHAFKDLKKTERGYALVIQEKGCRDYDYDKTCVRYVEIHIPIDKHIEPGTETHGTGQQKKTEHLHEIQ